MLIMHVFLQYVRSWIQDVALVLAPSLPSLCLLFWLYFMGLEHLQCPVCRAWIYCQTSSTLIRGNYEGRPIVRVFDVEPHVRQEGSVASKEDSASDGEDIAADREQVATQIDDNPPERVSGSGSSAVAVSSSSETAQGAACSRKRPRE